jgi:DNA-binding beta-propeller fold protein YncE
MCHVLRILPEWDIHNAYTYFKHPPAICVGQPAHSSGQAAPLAAPAGQTVMPFDGLNHPFGVAVDTAGSVYVADKFNHRVLKLAAGSSSQTVLPFPTGPDGLVNGVITPGSAAGVKFDG